MTFQEKSITASLVTMLVVWGYYFFKLYEYRRAEVLNFESVQGLLIVVVVMTIIVSIIAHALIAGRKALEEGPEEDERDQLITQRATYLASYVLGAGVISTLLIAVVTASLVATINVLVLFFVLSELTRYVLQLLYYRRGI